jgi:hypothetical protein
MLKGVTWAAALCTLSACNPSRKGIRTRRTKHLYLTAVATDATGLELPIRCKPKK